MNDWVQTLLNEWDIAGAEVLASVIIAPLILALAVLLHLVMSRIVVRIVAAAAVRTPLKWDETLVRHGVFHRLASIAPGLLVHALAGPWLGEETLAAHMFRVAALLWIVIMGLRTVFALLDGLHEIYDGLPFSRQMPIRSFIQVLKLAASLMALLVGIALLLGRSPALLVSGFGAMTAILMLVFKDPILGFVAGIQLSANRMLAVGDWLEMPRYNADGDVVEISLTTVKIRNWDQTITTVPTYALISDSFKNWRGMQEIGGRRIKRSLFIDMHSVRFLVPEDLARLRKAQLIARYIEDKLVEIERHNRERQIDPASPVNGRHLTNIGTFRAYLLAYLKAHPAIHPGLITMVRQLQPTSDGLPIEIYAFTADTGWIAHEAAQSDIFDHILAVIPEFGLRVFQSPSGSDMRELAAGFRRSD